MTLPAWWMLVCSWGTTKDRLESRPDLPFPMEESWDSGPTQSDENGSCPATTLPGSTALPFVISTEAKRSGEICGSHVTAVVVAGIEL
jgi:hypothetical protein